MMKNMGALCMVSWVLVMVGGINWGLVGLFQLNLVEKILGEGTLLTRLVYILVGVAAGYMIFKKVKKQD
jgi:uncharacterized membrane protein YuzA (DUF378 family)